MKTVHQVAITPDMILEARNHSDKTIAALKARGSKQYTGAEHPDDFYHGYLGEHVFLAFLRSQGVRGVYHRRKDGIADARPEFEIYIPAGTVSLDTKTASQPFHRRIMLPEAQFKIYDADYYVGIRLHGEVRGEIHGYCTKDEFALKSDGFDDQKTPTMWAYLARLHEITDLWCGRG